MATQQVAESPSELGGESLGVGNGKLGIWTFLIMDAMTFAGFLAGYARLRWTPGSEWPNPYETFGVTGIQLTAFNTFVLVCSSVSMVHALSETIRGDLVRARKWMLVTIFGGLLFLGIQGFEWTHLILEKWPYLVGGEAVDYNPNFAGSFLSLTGFHGIHVAIGVMYNVIIYLGLRRGSITQDNSSMVELAGLYWHFVDLVWILVFTFVYLI